MDQALDATRKGFGMGVGTRGIAAFGAHYISPKQNGIRSLEGKEITNEGITVIGEGMTRVEATASKIPGVKTLNDMPNFMSTKDQITSQMMEYNRKWIVKQMRSRQTILDIGRDATRTNPSIFYNMEQNMLKNYQKLHSSSLNIVKP